MKAINYSVGFYPQLAATVYEYKYLDKIMKLRKASHCSYRIRYHMVFVVKYRKELITPEIFDFMKEIVEN